MTGVLKIRTTKEFGESTVSKILDLVENSSSKKVKIRELYFQICQILYSCCVLRCAGTGHPSSDRKHADYGNNSGMWGDWIYRALTFLVISCPCALVISIPLSFFAGIGGASNQGILVKGSNYLETLSQTKYVVFDKTGTMTKGVFEVSRHPSQ